MIFKVPISDQISAKELPSWSLRWKHDTKEDLTVQPAIANMAARLRPRWESLLMIACGRSIAIWPNLFALIASFIVELTKHSRLFPCSVPAPPTHRWERHPAGKKFWGHCAKEAAISHFSRLKLTSLYNSKRCFKLFWHEVQLSFKESWRVCWQMSPPTAEVAARELRRCLHIPFAPWNWKPLCGIIGLRLRRETLSGFRSVR